MSESSATARPKAWFSLILALIFIAIVVIGIIFPPADWVPAEAWGEALQSAGVAGVLSFVLAGAAATSIGLPRQLLAFIAGLAFGVFEGLLLSLLAAIAGCCITVLVSRRFLAASVATRFPRFIAMLQRVVRKDVFIKILILRLQPLGTNLMTNVCIGLTDARIGTFLMASAVGYVPQMLVFTLLGSGVRVGSTIQLFLSSALLCISLLLGVYLYRKHRAEFQI